MTALAATVTPDDDFQHRWPPTQRLVGKSSDHAVARRAFTTATPAPLIGFGDPAREDRTDRLESLSNDFEAEPVEPGEGGQVGAAEADRRGSVGHVEVFQMASVRTSIFGRPRLLPAQ